MSKILFITENHEEIDIVKNFLENHNIKVNIITSNYCSCQQLIENNSFQLIIASVPSQPEYLDNLLNINPDHPIFLLADDESEIMNFTPALNTKVLNKKSDYLSTIKDFIISQTEQIDNSIIKNLLIDIIDDAICILDKDHIIKYWNNAAENLFGWYKNETLNKKFNSIIKLKFSNNGENLTFDEIINNNKTVSVESKITTKYNTTIFVELKITKVYLEKVNSTFILLKFREITAYKEVQKQLHILSDIVLNTSDGIILSDLNKNIIFVNKAKADMLGYDVNELIGKDVSVLSGNDPAIINEIQKVHKQVLTEGIWSGEINELKKDGTQITIHLTSKLLKTDDGRPYAILGTSQDITNKKGLEKKLIESEEWYRTLITSINGILIFFDPFGKIKFVNQATEKILDYTFDELVNVDFFQLFNFEDQLQQDYIMDKILSGISLQGINSTIKTKSGNERNIVCNLSPRYDSERLINGIICNGIDITELKSLEKKLAETYNYIENIIKNSADGIATFDLDAKVVTWNKACEKIYGYKYEEVLGKTILNTVPEKHLPEWKKIYHGVLQGKTYENIEVERIRKDGKIINLLLTVSPIQNLEGKVIGISSFIRDITEKKLLEKQAYLSEAKYRQLFEESKDFIFETSADGKFISINQAGVEILGYDSKEEILKIDIAKDLYINPEEREKFKSEIEKFGYVIDFEVHLKRKNGDKITLMETATAVYDDNNQIIGYRGIGRDLTEKKQHQERILSLLIASQAFSRTTTEEEIFDTIAKAIKRLAYNLIILMRQGNSLKIARSTFDENMARALEKMYNFRFSTYLIPYKKFAGLKSVIDEKKTVLNEKSIERLIEILPGHIPRNEIETFINEIGYKNRSISLPLVVFNDVIGVLIINSDEFKQDDIPIFNLYAAQLNAALENARLYKRLTQANEELRNAYEKLHESQTMLIHSEKMKAIGDLASGVAHDFNNLLGIISGRAQLLQLRTTDQKTKNDLDVILKAAMDGAETVRRLQDFAKKKVDDNASAIDVNLIIEDVIQLTQTKWKDIAHQKGINIEIIKEFDNLPIIFGSGSELREILTNLILNAVDAMPKGGTIKITTKNLDRLYSIIVEDTGVGIPEEALPKIFNPFYTTKGERGTGLGLAMVKTLVAKRQGDIQVQSQVGVGTKFTITFPKLNVEKNLSNDKIYTTEIRKVSSTNPYNVLIIDDEEEIRLLLSEILQQANYGVVIAKDGKEGIEKFKNNKIDIVFTDLGMPDVNGWEVAKEVKKINPNTPVILISGWGRDLKDQDLTNTGVDFLASKPFHIDEIFQILVHAKHMIENKE